MARPKHPLLLLSHVMCVAPPCPYQLPQHIPNFDPSRPDLTQLLRTFFASCGGSTTGTHYSSTGFLAGASKSSGISRTSSARVLMRVQPITPVLALSPPSGRPRRFLLTFSSVHGAATAFCKGTLDYRNRIDQKKSLHPLAHVCFPHENVSDQDIQSVHNRHYNSQDGFQGEHHWQALNRKDEPTASLAAPPTIGRRFQLTLQFTWLQKYLIIFGFPW